MILLGGRGGVKKSERLRKYPKSVKRGYREKPLLTEEITSGGRVIKFEFYLLKSSFHEHEKTLTKVLI